MASAPRRSPRLRPMSRSSAAPAASGRDEAPPDLRLVPVVACLWAGCWCATTGGAWAVGAAAGFGLASLIALGLLVRRRRWGTPWLAASAVAGLLACAAGALAWWTTQAGPVAAWARDGAVMRVEARVRGDPVTWPAHGVLPERTVVPVEVLAVVVVPVEAPPVVVVPVDVAAVVAVPLQQLVVACSNVVVLAVVVGGFVFVVVVPVVVGSDVVELVVVIKINRASRFLQPEASKE